MAFPDPLQIEPARLVVDGDRVVDADHGDWYFQYDGIDETRYVYLEGSGLLDRLAAHEDLVVGEIGFGTGLSFRLVCAAMAETGYRGHLSYVGVEGRPLTAAQAEAANSLRPPALRWTPPQAQPRAGFVPVPPSSSPRPDLAPEMEPTTKSGMAPDLLLLHGEASAALARLQAQVDLWFFDGFSPSKNPEAWTPALFAEVARLSRPGAQFSTFTAASEVRHRLEAVGFRVVKRSGWGKKREHMVGTFAGSWTPRPTPANQSVTIIGAGIAGQSLALAAGAAGLPVTLHGTGAPPEGSGVPLALVNYRPSGDRGPLGHLRKAAFFAAQQTYGDSAFASLAPDKSEDRGTSDVRDQDRPMVRFGVEALVSDDRLRGRWDREADVEHQWIDDSRVLVPGAFSLDTAAFRRAVLAQVACVPDAVDGPQALNRILADAPPGALTLVAAGLGSSALLRLADRPLESLRPNRGQQDEVRLESADDGADALRRPLNFGRLLLPQTGSDRAWLGASFDRDPPENWQAPSERDRTDNLERMAQALPSLLVEATGRSWVGLRATTPDHLPLAGLVGHSLGLLTGLGSKGFLYAPILSQSLIAEVLGRPLPIEAWVWQALHPDRFHDQGEG
jgi:tRNA 5-methylaminomethyl-2-thiouridine biosynthesis bifunctional protein